MTDRDETLWITVGRTTLSDGSHVFDVIIGTERLRCETEAAAYRLAEAIDHTAINTQLDGWRIAEGRH